MKRLRYQKAAPGYLCSMTDGVQRVFGMEHRPTKDLEVLSWAGLKSFELVYPAGRAQGNRLFYRGSQ